MPRHEEGTTVVVAALPTCDYCKMNAPKADPATLPLAQYDGRTWTGVWANMCLLHFRLHGVGLGTGFGQRLLVEGKVELSEREEAMARHPAGKRMVRERARFE